MSLGKRTEYVRTVHQDAAWLPKTHYVFELLYALHSKLMNVDHMCVRECVCLCV